MDSPCSSNDVYFRGSLRQVVADAEHTLSTFKAMERQAKDYVADLKSRLDDLNLRIEAAEREADHRRRQTELLKEAVKHLRQADVDEVYYSEANDAAEAKADAQALAYAAVEAEADLKADLAYAYAAAVEAEDASKADAAYDAAEAEAKAAYADAEAAHADANAAAPAAA